ncbi:general odorant-binding protein 57c-like [Musca vetustissima]|uniref:general odorant-binding protein 57c-like n=1 Tax=Musca vetustissima TaxID=27455 RepID=UPI002AB65691|nr:general odorant-binding protein 57c-like [Musca vetustissima]
MKAVNGRLILLAMLLAIVELTQAIDLQHLEEKAMQVAKECVKETSLSSDEVKLFMENAKKEIDEMKFTDKMKCYMSCLYKKVGIFDANGKPKIPELTKFLEERYKNKKDKVKPAMMKCAAMNDPNLCEHVFKFEGCIAKEIMGK